MRSIYLSITICWVIIFLANCKEEQKPFTLYEDKELAILMREIYEDGMQMKQAIARGEQPISTIEHPERILSVEATEPEKQSSQEYKAFAHYYIEAMEKMKDADYRQSVVLFDAAVMACQNCHRALCPGPLVKVNKLERRKINSD